MRKSHERKKSAFEIEHQRLGIISQEYDNRPVSKKAREIFRRKPYEVAGDIEEDRKSCKNCEFFENDPSEKGMRGIKCNYKADDDGIYNPFLTEASICKGYKRK